MKITILNKKESKNYIPKEKAIIIRMGDSFPLPKLKGNYLNIYQFYFSDVDEISDYFITETEAKEIIKIVDENKDNINEIVVHCEYGQGRSPAVALAISEYLRIENNILKEYPEINKSVLNKIRDIFEETHHLKEDEKPLHKHRLIVFFSNLFS